MLKDNVLTFSGLGQVGKGHMRVTMFKSSQEVKASLVWKSSSCKNGCQTHRLVRLRIVDARRATPCSSQTEYQSEVEEVKTGLIGATDAETDLGSQLQRREEVRESIRRSE